MRGIELNLLVEFAARIGKNSMQAMVMAQFTTYLGSVIYFKLHGRHTPAGAVAGRRADLGARVRRGAWGPGRWAPCPAERWPVAPVRWPMASHVGKLSLTKQY